MADGTVAGGAAPRRISVILTRLAQAEDADLLLHEALDAAIDIAGADMGNIQLLEPANGNLKIAASRGFALPGATCWPPRTSAARWWLPSRGTRGWPAAQQVRVALPEQGQVPGQGLPAGLDIGGSLLKCQRQPAQLDGKLLSRLAGPGRRCG